MLNLFGALGALGRILPGYVEGQRQAVQDNWTDLNQYNQVQHGQLSNAFDEAIFNPRVSSSYDAAENSRMGVLQNDANLQLQQAMFPGMLQSAHLQSLYQPSLTAMQNTGQLGYLMRLIQQLYGGGGQQMPMQQMPMQQAQLSGIFQQYPQQPQLPSGVSWSR